MIPVIFTADKATVLSVKSFNRGRDKWVMLIPRENKRVSSLFAVRLRARGRFEQNSDPLTHDPQRLLTC